MGREYKYKSIEDVIAAYKVGELAEEAGNVLVVDNDSCTIYVDDGEDEGECVFSIHPAKLLDELLAYVGIPFEAA